MHVSRRRGDRGTVIPLVAGSLLMILVMTSFVVDLGNARQEKSKASSTADAGALAGAGGIIGMTDGGIPPAGVPQGVNDAAVWAFKNIGLSTPATPTTSGAGCGSGGQCDYTYSAGDTANTVVTVTFPYATTKVDPAKGTTYDSGGTVRVQACWDVATFFAKVIGISKIRTCGRAAAYGSGSVQTNSDAQDGIGDPYAKCQTESGLLVNINPTSGSGLKGGSTVSAEYKGTYAIDTDPKGPSGYAFDIVYDGVEWQTPSSAFPATLSDPRKTPAVKFKIPSSASVGMHSISYYVRDVQGNCDQFTWTFVIGNPAALTEYNCKEDLFRGGTNPTAFSKVQPGDWITATYYDETDLYRSASGGTNVDPFFKWDGQDLIAAGLVTIQPVAGTGKGEYKFGQQFKWQVPVYDPFNPGTLVKDGKHTIEVLAFDSDQNKAGGDCGYAKWTVSYFGGKGAVKLIE